MVVFNIYFASSSSGIGVTVGAGVSVDIGEGVAVSASMEGTVVAVCSAMGVATEGVQEERRKMERITSEGRILFRMVVF
jgi:hypothetical protein